MRRTQRAPPRTGSALGPGLSVRRSTVSGSISTRRPRRSVARARLRTRRGAWLLVHLGEALQKRPGAPDCRLDRRCIVVRAGGRIRSVGRADTSPLAKVSTSRTGRHVESAAHGSGHTTGACAASASLTYWCTKAIAESPERARDTLLAQRYRRCLMAAAARSRIRCRPSWSC
jgi:hypothetical protein